MAGTVAAASTALSSPSSSLSLHNRLCPDHNFPFPHLAPSFLFTNLKPLAMAKSLKLASSKILTHAYSSPPSRSLPLLHILFPAHSCRCAAEDTQFPADDGEGDSELEMEAESDPEEEVQEQEQPQSDSSEEGRLYVGNLPFSITSSQLSEIFSEAGVVRSVEIIYDRVTDRSRGFAFVTMGSLVDAKAAIKMFDESQVGGRSLKVNFPEVPRGGERRVLTPKIKKNYKGFVDTPHKIYAGNLGWDVTSQGLREVFADQPGFLSAKVIYERETGRSRGFGFASFSSAEEAESAINSLNGKELEGRPLRLNVASERAQSSPPTSSPRPPSVDYNDGAPDSMDGQVFSGISS